ncbi:glycosyltransferase family 39 protein [Asanoa ferruginea]|uniref:glycosyltransferase family 39 protein n=2 Tax=Asanoa ferruginea TaxID=53367 RepID=UPI000E224F0E|nr:glycosyltransferase family 39 protein [Asanoa ferruginea]
MWLILVLHVAVVLWQTALFPNFRSPDERQHVDLITQVEQGVAWPWPDPGTLRMAQGSGAGGFTKSNRIDRPLHLADRPLPPRADRPSFSAAGGTTPLTAQPRNQLIQHPPLYYVAGAAVLQAIPGWDRIPFDLTYLALRWWNVLLAAALPLLLWAVARRLRLAEPLPVAAALVPLAIPELTHNESAVNNDNLLILLYAVLTLLVVRVLTGDATRRTALAIGAVGSLALLTKGFALLVPLWVGVAYAVPLFRGPGRRRVVWALAVAWLGTLPGVAWWIHNRIAYGSLQPHGRFTSVPELVARYPFTDGGVHWLLRLLERMNTLFFVHDQTGGGGHHAPWFLAFAAAVLIVAGVVVALALRALDRSTALVLLFPMVGLLAIVAKGSYEQFAATHTYAGMQGRYLYGGLIGVAIVALAALRRVPAAVSRAAPLGVLLFAILIQTVYIGYTVKLFWLPADGDVLAALRAIAAWYAFPPVVLALIVTILLVSLGAALFATVRLAGRPGAAAWPARRPTAAARLTRRPAVFARLARRPAVAARLARRSAVFARLARRPAVFARLARRPAVAARLARRSAVFARLARRPAVFARLARRPAVAACPARRPAVAARLARRSAVFARLARRPAVAACPARRPAVAARLARRSAVFARLARRPAVFARLARRPAVFARLARRPAVVAWLGRRPAVAVRLARRPAVAAWLGRRPAVFAQVGRRPAVAAGPARRPAMAARPALSGQPAVRLARTLPAAPGQAGVAGRGASGVRV